jgi:hypothetical protein
MLLYLQVVGVVDFLDFRKSNEFRAERPKRLGYKDMHSFEKDGHSFIESTRFYKPTNIFESCIAGKS